MFETFKTRMRNHIQSMVEEGNLFTTDLNRDKLWELYLNSFKPEDNLIFRERTEHNCSACRQFVKSFGHVVRIKGNEKTTIWDFDMSGTKYDNTVKVLSEYVKTHVLGNVFVSGEARIGIDRNYEHFDSGEVKTWEHLCFDLPPRFVNSSRSTIGSVLGAHRSTRDVFQRSLESISANATQAVLELIAQGSLYRGEEWEQPLRGFLQHQVAYAQLTHVGHRDHYTWEQSVIVGAVIGRIRNHSIGVLLTDITEGLDLDAAVRRYESIVAPNNYKRPKPIYTQAMLKKAEETITELGYMGSLGRRFATLDDITVNNILFADRDVAKLKTEGNPFDEMAADLPLSSKAFERVDEIPIARFVSEVLPQSRHVQVLLENRHAGNLVSLIAPQKQDAPTMFKWNNGFSWAYTGNIADAMKERVKALGGDVTGVLRFSIQWNESGDNHDDLDAHCIEPSGNEIYYGNKRKIHRSSGILDVDIITPWNDTKDGVAVENITWSVFDRMPDGVYKLFVHCYSSRSAKSGFSAEVEFDGQIYSFAYNTPLRQSEKIQVAEVSKRNNEFSIKELIPSQLSSRKLWGLDSQKFHPVSVMMMSPNYWDGQDGIGNRHFFFMLDGCQNPDQPNGFFNEYLRNELIEHRRVLEALGGKMRVEPSESQLSGLGFSSTQRNAVVVQVEGHVKRTLKVII